MTAWKQAAAPMASTTGIAADVGQLAASYQLGTPVQAYRPTFELAPFCGVTFLGLVGTGFGTIGTLLVVFVPLFIPALRGFVGVSWIAFFVLTAAIGLVLLSLSALTLRGHVRGDKAYECTEGFLQVDKDGAVKAAVRWDQMQVLWHRRHVQRTFNTSTNSYSTTLVDTYSVGTANGAQFPIVSTQLWKRIEEAFVPRHFPQALAMFNAGQRVPFNAVSVSQLGGVGKEILYKPGIIGISLQNLAHVRISSTELCFAGRAEVVRVPVSETANVCLLEALLKTVTGGRVVCISPDRPLSACRLWREHLIQERREYPNPVWELYSLKEIYRVHRSNTSQ